MRWKEGTMVCFKAVSRYLLGWTEENHLNLRISGLQPDIRN